MIISSMENLVSLLIVTPLPPKKKHQRHFKKEMKPVSFPQRKGAQLWSLTAVCEQRGPGLQL